MSRLAPPPSLPQPPVAVARTDARKEKPPSSRPAVNHTMLGQLTKSRINSTGSYQPLRGRLRPPGWAAALFS